MTKVVKPIENPIFVSITNISEQTGLPYGQVLKDVHNGTLKAMKRGKSYYIYNTDANDYIFNLVCNARGIDPSKAKELCTKYDMLSTLDSNVFIKMTMDTLKEMNNTNDKLKDKITRNDL